MKSRQDLIAAALKLLNVLGAGQDPEAEDAVEVDNLIDGKIRELNQRDIIFFTNTQQFEDAYLDPLSVIIANQAAPLFGQPRDAEREGVAIATLYAMRPSTYVKGSVLSVDYF
jgi:hypothetical protein